MRFYREDKYFTITIYTVIGGLSMVAGALLLFHLKEVIIFIWQFIRRFIQLISPLLLGGIIAYLLDPIVCFYENKSKKVHRTIPTMFTFLTVIAFLGLFILIIVLNLQAVLGTTSLQNITKTFYRYGTHFEQMLLQMTSITKSLPFSLNEIEIVSSLYGKLNIFFNYIGQKIVTIVAGLGAQSMKILLSMVIAFYLLQDKKAIIKMLRHIAGNITSKRVYQHVVILGKDIDYIFSNYIRGQMLDAMIIALLTSSALTIIGIDFAVIIGIIAGIFNLIPYFGPLVGFVLAGLMGVIGPEPIRAIYAVVALLFIQQLDAWIIVPKVVGEKVKLHPVVVLLSILIGGNLFGIIGMLMGVPVAAFIRILLLRYMEDIFI